MRPYNTYNSGRRDIRVRTLTCQSRENPKGRHATVSGVRDQTAFVYIGIYNILIYTYILRIGNRKMEVRPRHRNRSIGRKISFRFQQRHLLDSLLDCFFIYLFIYLYNIFNRIQ